MSEITFVRLYDETGVVDLAAGEEHRIDAAVSAYLDGGCTRDTLLHLTTLNGAPYVTRASKVCNWLVSTPEVRRRATEIDKALADEEKENRQAAGIWEAEP